MFYTHCTLYYTTKSFEFVAVVLVFSYLFSILKKATKMSTCRDEKKKKLETRRFFFSGLVGCRMDRGGNDSPFQRIKLVLKKRTGAAAHGEGEHA